MYLIGEEGLCKPRARRPEKGQGEEEGGERECVLDGRGSPFLGFLTCIKISLDVPVLQKPHDRGPQITECHGNTVEALKNIFTFLTQNLHNPMRKPKQG